MWRGKSLLKRLRLRRKAKNKKKLRNKLRSLRIPEKYQLTLLTRLKKLVKKFRKL